MIVVHTDTGFTPNHQSAVECMEESFSASSLMCIAGNRQVRKRGRHLRISMENHGLLRSYHDAVTRSLHLKIHLCIFSPCSRQESRHDQQKQQVHQATRSVHVSLLDRFKPWGRCKMRGRDKQQSRWISPLPLSKIPAIGARQLY